MERATEVIHGSKTASITRSLIEADDLAPVRLLETERHRDAARSFYDHFSLTPEGPVERFLERLIEQYTRIPYENLSKIIKRAASGTLEEKLRLPDEVIADHFEWGLGGTCFSLSFYLLCILHHAGIPAYISMAHMGRRENTHCVTVAETRAGKYLLDAGYLINQPVPMRPDGPVFLQLPHTCVRLIHDPRDDHYHVLTGKSDELKPRYRFHDLPVRPEDLLVYWQRSFDQMNNICLTFRREEKLIYLHGDYLRETRLDGFTRDRIKGGLPDVIAKVAGIRESTVEEALSAIRRPGRGER